MKIMTYNLRYASTETPNAWVDRKEIMAELVTKESPDIIGTQEGLHEQLEDLSALLPNYHWIGLGREGGSNGEYMAIFYKKDRFQVKAYNHFWLSDTPREMGSNTWGNSCVRMATWIRFFDRQTGKQFYLVNTHLDHESENGRMKSAKLIREMSDSFDPEIPLILTGDFNAGAESTPYTILVDNGPFTDAWDTAEHKINEELGSFNDFNDPLGNNVRIDWILYRGNLSVHAIKTIDTQFDGKYPSDHFPIVAEVEL